MKTHLLFILTVLLYGECSLGQTCQKYLVSSETLISPHSPTFEQIKKEYRELRKDPEINDGTKTPTALLNRALDPLVDTYIKILKDLPDTEIRKRALDFLSNFPPQTSTYGKFSQIEQNGGRLESLVLANDTARSGLRMSTLNAYSRFNLPENLGLLLEHESFLWLEPKAFADVSKFGSLMTIISSCPTAIGGYGLEFSLATQATTRIMISLAAEKLIPIAKETYRSLRPLLDVHVGRVGYAQAERADKNTALVTTAMESILSLNQLIHLLLAKKIEGVDSPSEALRWLVHEGSNSKGVLSEATARLPMGLNGSFGLTGLHFHKPLLEIKNNNIQLTAEFKNFLDREKRGRKSICPFSALFRKDGSKSNIREIPEKTGIQELAEVYLKVYEQVKLALEMHRL